MPLSKQEIECPRLVPELESEARGIWRRVWIQRVGLGTRLIGNTNRLNSELDLCNVVFAKGRFLKHVFVKQGFVTLKNYS